MREKKLAHRAERRGGFHGRSDIVKTFGDTGLNVGEDSEYEGVEKSRRVISSAVGALRKP